MKFLTLELIKAQCIVDEDFHDDDLYLTHLGETAESLVEQEIDQSLIEVAAGNNGEMPTALLHSMLLIVDYLYAQRGSNDANPDIPNAYLHLCRLFRNWGSSR